MNQRFKDRIAEGMVVKNAEGKRLGKIVSLRATTFDVVKGLLFSKKLTFDYAEIVGVKTGGVVVVARATFVGQQQEPRKLETKEGIMNKESNPKEITVKEIATKEIAPEPKAPQRATQLEDRKELRITLVEEEVTVEKHLREIGEVRLRKEIVTEQKQITVPVIRELLTIERLPAIATARVPENAFREETIEIALHEEHVELSKRPVVKEELRVLLQVEHVEKTASTSVRRERAEVETKGAVTERVSQQAEGKEL